MKNKDAGLAAVKVRRLSRLLLVTVLGAWLHVAWAETVEGLLQEVLRTNPAVQSRQATVRSRQASVDSANWQFYPSPSLSSERVSRSANDTAYAADSTVTTLRLQQTLWTAGRLTAQTSRAQADQRAGTWIMQDDERLPLAPGEEHELCLVRFRTLGCYSLSGAIESAAATLDDIIVETFAARSSERQGRLIDSDQPGSREKKKQVGYF